MSIDSARVVCTGCDYETREVFRPILIRYQTGNGQFIETGRTNGWCYDCTDYSSIERIHPDALREKRALTEQERREARDQLEALSQGLLSRFRNRAQMG